MAIRPYFDRRRKNFRRDARGAAAVEFGFVLPPFLLTLFAILEIGYSYFLTASLDYATQNGARAVMTGAVSMAGMTANQFRTQVVCPALPRLFNCNNVIVNITVAPSGQSPSGYYTYVNTTRTRLVQPPLNNNQTSFCPGSGAQYIVLQILYPVTFLTSFFSSGATVNYNGNLVHLIWSNQTVKSEPFVGATSYSGC